MISVRRLEGLRVLLQGAMQQHAVLRQRLKLLQRDAAIACGMQETQSR